MDSVDLAKEVLRGPRGAPLDNPKFNPERRNATFRGKEVEGGLALHQFEDVARQGLKNEKAWHRMAAYMLLNGRTNSEIAMAANVSVGEVSTLRAQRWFQELLATLANEAGAELTGLIQGHAQDALLRIVDLAQNAGSERVRLTANIQLLEQAHGKPTQKVISHTTHSSFDSVEEETKALLVELETLRARNSAITLPES